MIKKISALVLALVICLSVVVMPTSAAGVELGTYSAAFALEWDKENYEAGDTAYLSLYIDVKDGIAINQINTTIVVDDRVLDIDTSVPPTIVYNEDIASYFKTDGFATWLTDSQKTRVESSSTEAEKAMYTTGIKWAAGKNAQGDHENAKDQYDGFYFDSYDSSVPVAVYEFKVKEGIADGTAINALIVSGSATGTAATAPVMLKYYKNPGTAKTTANLAATEFDFSQAVATAKVGAACDHSLVWTTTTEPTYTTAGVETGKCKCGQKTETRPIAMKVLVSALKGQMRYNLEDNTKFDVRALAKIPAADFEAVFGDAANAKAMIKEAGFVFASGKNITAPDMDAVKALVKDGTEVTGYAKKTITYISDTVSPGNYVFSCLVTGISEGTVSSEDQSLIAIGYVAWDADKDGVVDSYAFYPETQTIKFADLYANKK